MAGDQALTEVLRSGPLYLVVRGGRARLIRPGDRAARRAVPLGSAAAHVHVDEPWAAVPPADPAHAAALDAASDDAGWEPPGYLKDV